MDSVLNQGYPLQTGYLMPILGLGTWQLIGSACTRIVSKALELGYRHIDTAELYGNESEIGQAIIRANRDHLFLVSKVSSAHLSTNDVIRSCRRSLERLGTNYLDLYLIHWPNDEIPLAKTMAGMQYLVEERMVRSVGVSNFDVPRLQEAMAAAHVPVCNDQVEYHPYRHRREIPRFCEEHDIALTAYCPLARGRVMHDPLLLRIGRQYGKSPAQVSLHWLLQKGALVIPKASSVEHLKENVDMDGWDLSPEEMQAIDENGIEARLIDAVYT
jgi:2,5-diketo-D-gluconate reductase B